MLTPPPLRTNVEAPDPMLNTASPQAENNLCRRVLEAGENVAYCSSICAGLTLFAVYITYVAFNIFIYQLFERTPQADPRSFEEMLFATMLLR